MSMTIDEVMPYLAVREVLSLTTAELVALENMGAGHVIMRAPLPDMEPADFARVLVEARDALVHRCVLTPEYAFAPWFAEVWSAIAEPVAVGQVSRFDDEGNIATWIFYVSTTHFVEQTTFPEGVVFAAGELGQLIGRILLDAGLFRDFEVDGVSVDPLPAVEPRVVFDFRQVGAGNQRANFAAEGDRWTVDGQVLTPQQVIDRVTTMVTSALTVA